jgi:molybdopterin synthase catalytic subunit
MIELTFEPIDPSRPTELVRSPMAGAVCLFLGTVREQTGERHTASLCYEAYEPMARLKLAEAEAEARRRWALTEVALVHRLGGPFEPGTVVVAVAVSSPHRAEAFAACAWLMDTIKSSVPIWKQERYTDGSEEWVTPGDQSPVGTPTEAPSAEAL